MAIHVSACLLCSCKNVGRHTQFFYVELCLSLRLEGGAKLQDQCHKNLGHECDVAQIPLEHRPICITMLPDQVSQKDG